MLLALILLHLTALTFANPFHKYPYVFLLDVGNEELEKVNTEQIRISKQGGSLALRYPAIGNGDDIAHVRVSGIDFGTNLKASIVDGGPGYKYVVLVLIGNPGVAFDAVITVQTVPTDGNNEASLQNIDDSSRNTNYQVSEDNDANDSAEDLTDSAESEKSSQVNVMNENAELTQESSNVYSYSVNEALSGYGNDVHSNERDQDESGDGDEYENDDDDENDSESQDIGVLNNEGQIRIDETGPHFEDNSHEDDSPVIAEDSQVYNNDQLTHNNDYSPVIDGQIYESVDRNQEQVNTNLYEEYQAFKQSLYNEEPNKNQIDFEEIFGEEYDDEDYNRRTDINNNFVDGNEVSAIAY